MTTHAYLHFVGIVVFWSLLVLGSFAALCHHYERNR